MPAGDAKGAEFGARVRAKTSKEAGCRERKNVAGKWLRQRRETAACGGTEPPGYNDNQSLAHTTATYRSRPETMCSKSSSLRCASRTTHATFGFMPRVLWAKKRVLKTKRPRHVKRNRGDRHRAQATHSPLSRSRTSESPFSRP